MAGGLALMMFSGGLSVLPAANIFKINAINAEAAKEPYEFLKLNDIETPDPDGNPEPEPKVNGKWDTTNINSRAFTVTVK